jgi:3-hydroxy-9,10-secoandrosta-1,3,5(10)-triene-9,17-dione monooxygenase reductase component
VNRRTDIVRPDVARLPSPPVGNFDAARFRQVLGHFPTGVTIITGAADGEIAGLTIGSFASVSLDPPLVGFLPMGSSTSWPTIERSGSFCVNVLAADQGELCWKFARSTDEDRFGGVGWHAAPSGSPILDGAIAWIDCSIEHIYEMGDHMFVLGRVHHLDTWDGAEPAPLLFFKGKLGGFASLA